MKLVFFEGTSGEFNEIAHNLALNPPSPSPIEDDTSFSEEGPSESYELPLDVVLDVLTRRPLAPKVKAMFRLLYRAGERRVTSTEIREEIDFEHHQFRGLMGAFGKRLANTAGVPAGAKLLDGKWDHNLIQMTWTLPPNVRTALEQLDIT